MATTQRGTGWHRRVAAVVVWPFVLIVFVCGGLVAVMALAARARREGRALRAALGKGRVGDWWSLHERARERPGTIIVDWRTVGWSVMHVWWTPRDVGAEAAAAGVVVDGDAGAGRELASDAITPFCQGRYLDPVSGDAVLIDVHANPWSGKRVRRAIAAFRAVSRGTGQQAISSGLHRMAEARRRSG